MNAPSMAKMGEKPNLAQMMDFLRSGIAVMESDATRELLKDPKVNPGPKLVELQRANWDTLGVDQDIGCQALNELVPGDAAATEACELKHEFVYTSMRIFLRALEDRQPPVLEKSKPMPREVIIEFFNACNTRLDLPETAEFLLAHFAQTPEREKRGDAIAEMQRKTLEVLGWERTHGCALLEQIPQDFPDDKELLAMLQGWYMKAKQTFVMVEQIVIQRQFKEELAGNPEMQKAAEIVEAMSAKERGEVIERMQKKVQVLVQLPPDARQEHLKKQTPEDRMELLKGLVIAWRVMQQQASQVSEVEGAAAPTGAAPAQQEMM